MDYEDAVRLVTGPGCRFETRTEEVGGIAHTVFANVPRSLRQLFSEIRKFGDETFLVYETERWSFDRVCDEVAAVADVLRRQHGVGTGDRVAIAMRNYPEWVVAFGAVVSVGAIAVAMNAFGTEAELAFGLADSGAKVLIADSERIERTRECRVPTIAVRCAVPGADSWPDVGADLPETDVDPDADATILYTSGTSGVPKGAVSTHRAILQALAGFRCRGAVQRLLETGDAAETPKTPKSVPVFILTVPLFHVTGLVSVLLSCVSNGLKLVMMHRWDSDRALELIERERVTNFVGVPAQSWDLLQNPRRASYDTSSLVSLGAGGSAVPPEIVRRVATSFPSGRPGIGYGMTETNAYGPQNAGSDYEMNPTSAGRGTPILQVSVRDPDGSEVAAGTQGEIWFKGPHLIRAYWNRPEVTVDTIVDGWLRTGDVGRVDRDGFVYVDDRLKDVVIRGGENIYSAEVEAALYELPTVIEAAVFGYPHERLGEEVAAVIVVPDGSTLTFDHVQAHVRARLASFKVPTILVLSTVHLPRNAAGKVVKRDLPAIVAAQRPPFD